MRIADKGPRPHLVEVDKIAHHADEERDKPVGQRGHLSVALASGLLLRRGRKHFFPELIKVLGLSAPSLGPLFRFKERILDLAYDVFLKRTVVDIPVITEVQDLNMVLVRIFVFSSQYSFPHLL